MPKDVTIYQETTAYRVTGMHPGSGAGRAAKIESKEADKTTISVI
jgi:hypothetical protein